MTLALKVAESGRNFETSFVESQTTNEAAETDTLNSNEPFDFPFFAVFILAGLRMLAQIFR